MCDNCASSIELKDIDATCHTKIIVSLLHDLQLNDQRATLLQLVDKFKVKWKGLGRSNQAVDLKREEIEQLIVQLIVDRVLKEEFQHTAYSTNAYVTLGPLWKPALEGNRPVKLEIAVLGSQAGGGDTSKGTKRSRMSDLEAKLDELRRELSSSSTGGISIFPHAVLSTQQISLLSCQKPTTEAELEKVIGKVKTEKYGGRIIELMRSHIADPGAGNGSDAKRRPKKDKDVVCVESSDDE